MSAAASHGSAQSRAALSQKEMTRSPHGPALTMPCENCHTSAGWKPIRAVPEFDHNRTKYPLRGMHEKVQCTQCHIKPVFTDVGKNCADCHADVHRRQMGPDCEQCHTVQGWNIAVQQVKDHMNRFPLLGAHAAVQCEQCHKQAAQGIFYGLSTACQSCHLTDWQKTNNPPHASAGSAFAPQNCQNCHVSFDSWLGATFNHSVTGFLLDGAHTTLVCTACHINNNYNLTGITNSDCGNSGCHLTTWQTTNNPSHASAPQSFPIAQCSTCHNDVSWNTATFNHSVTGFILDGAHATVVCTQCHTNNNYNLTGIGNSDCGNSGCHLTTWQQTNNPPHASSPQGFPIAQCSTCHNDVSWTTSTFNHTSTGFALTNAHANVACAQCHINNNYNLQIAPTDCGNSGCHLTAWQQTNNPPHPTSGTAFAASNCSNCHDTIAWTDLTSFNHSVTGFTLTGMHVSPTPTPCVSCHVNNNYTLTIQPTDCGNSSCHLKDWNSTQTLGGNIPNHVTAGFPMSQCSTCHNTQSWATSTFDHSTTGFALTNAHASVQCAQCHINGNYSLTIQPTDCGNSGCHLTTYNQTNNPAHASNTTVFPIANCSQCHDTIAWTDTTTFNHAATGFALTGTHSSPNPTACAACHVNNNYNLTSTDCMTCHQSSWNSTQTLGGNVPNHVAASFPTTATACATCHPITTWSAGQFDHSSTGFPLTNSHQMSPAGKVTACTQCHVGGNYSLTIQPTDCGNSGCHLNTYSTTTNPAHASNTSVFPIAQCSTCHDTITWTDNNFNHSTTGFNLTGEHAVPPLTCAQCHVNNNYNLTIQPTDCANAGCHLTDFNNANNPVHTAAATWSGFAASNCANCHSTASPFTTTSWNHSATSWALTGNHQMAPAGAATNCNQCHVGNNYGLNSTACYPCHTTDWNNTATLGGNIPNHITAGFPQTCDTCHDTVNWADSTFNHNNVGFPLTGLHTSVQCAQCHTTAAGGYNLPAPTTACGDANCHANDYNGTNNPVHSAAGTTFALTNCANCHSTAAAFTTTSWTHTSTGWALTGNHQMSPAGAATNCNQCHVSNNYGLNSTACYPCHTTDWNSTATLGGNIPNHITAGFPQTCDTCHDTVNWADSTFNHNNVGFPLTGLHTSVQCAQCHTTAAGGYNLPAPTTSCGDANCHQTDYNGTNNPAHSAAGTTFALTNCANCHTTAAAFTTTSWNHTSTGWALTGNHQMSPAGVVTNCNQCHTSNNYGLNSTACYPCHTTDWNSTATLGGNIPNHITAGFPQTCDTCHDMINWADSTFNHNNVGFPLTGLHASAVQCAQCHTTAAGGYNLPAPTTTCGDANCHASDYNGTNNPVHSAAGTTFALTNCGNCHTTAAAFTTTSWSHTSTGWALTGNHQMSPAGVVTNCNQCHTSNNYGLNSTACYPCHTTDWNSTQTLGGSVPNHITAGFPQTCDTCHDMINWADSTFNHNNVGFALTGLHTSVQCAQCHSTAAGGYNLKAPVTTCGDQYCHASDYSGTNNPVHSAAGTTFAITNCANCHTTAAAFTTTSWNHSTTGWALTGNHQMSPAGAATNCNQCHVGNNYGLSTGDCWNSNCHTTDWNSTQTLGGTVPNHVALQYPTSMCSTCHDTISWADGTFNHATTGWALTGAHLTTACALCHVSNNYSLTATNTACYGCHTADWNSTQTLGNGVPNHITAGYPTTCDSCHTTTNWLGATFNHTYFPIPHHNSVCADCHQTSDYSVFTCINCHTTTAHQQAGTDSTHQGVSGYTYGPETCYNCHKNGGGG